MTPAPAGANNGNRRTAERWSRFLGDRFESIVQARWSGESADLLVALHARRSHESIAAFRHAYPGTPVVVVLTGTDLYRDLPSDSAALQSLELSDAMVVLQTDAAQYVPVAHAAKAHVIFQSAETLPPRAKPNDVLEFVVVGHLRAEKDPLRVIDALRLVPAETALRVIHIGAALDMQIGSDLRRLAAREPRYIWTEGMDHAATREAMRRAHALIHPSLMEGGANAIAEAITSGTPVIASRVSGNIGMLGRDYPGLFPPGDSAELAKLMVRCTDSQFYSALNDASGKRSELFAPEREKAAVHRLVSSLLEARAKSALPQRT